MGIASQAQSWNLVPYLRIILMVPAIAQCPARYSKASTLFCPRKWHLRYKWEAFHLQGPSGSCKQRLNALFIVSLLITSQQTHALCHTYVRTTMGVSYAPPAYYADLLAECGRCYIKRFLDARRNCVVSQKRGQGGHREGMELASRNWQY